MKTVIIGFIVGVVIFGLYNFAFWRGARANEVAFVQSRMQSVWPFEGLTCVNGRVELNGSGYQCLDGIWIYQIKPVN